MTRHLISLIVVGISFILLPLYLDWVDGSGRLHEKLDRLALNGDPWRFAGGVLILASLHLSIINIREKPAGLEGTAPPAGTVDEDAS